MLHNIPLHHSAIKSAQVQLRQLRYCSMMQVKLFVQGHTLTVYTFNADWLKFEDWQQNRTSRRMYFDLVSKLRFVVLLNSLHLRLDPRRACLGRKRISFSLTSSPRIELFASFTDTIAKMGAISLSVHYLEILSKPGQGRGRALGDIDGEGRARSDHRERHVDRS